MTKRKMAVFATATVLGTLVLGLCLLLVADLYAHTRVEKSVGVNRQGFRGPVAGRKQPGETRVVMLGGSTVYGFGVEWDETIPAALERRLREHDPKIRVLNLGFIAEGSMAFLSTLQSYAYLDYDVVCLYEGYNDVLGDAEPNRAMLRHSSPVFRLTGYFPVLPMVLREKAASLRSGTANAAYESGSASAPRPVFTPNAANRAAAVAMEATATLTDSINGKFGRFTDVDRSRAHEGPGCAPPWQEYCRNVAAAVRFALSRQASVAVISQPRLRDAARMERHASQQRALTAMLAHDFGNEPRVRHVDASDAADLSNPAESFDTLHLTRQGNTQVGDRLAEPILSIINARANRGSR